MLEADELDELEDVFSLDVLLEFILLIEEDSISSNSLFRI
jgi:hypothetical protein